MEVERLSQYFAFEVMSKVGEVMTLNLNLMSFFYKPPNSGFHTAQTDDVRGVYFNSENLNNIVTICIVEGSFPDLRTTRLDHLIPQPPSQLEIVSRNVNR